MAAFPERPLRVLFLSAEAEPLVKVGGLGDYSGSLPKALNHLQDSNQNPALDVRVSLPYHKPLSVQPSETKKKGNFKIKKKVGFASGSFYQCIHDGIIFYLIKRDGNASGYDQVYNIKSIHDARKYIFFSLACLEILRLIDWKPDVIHANDWHSATALHKLSQYKKSNPFYQSIHSVLAIHNLPFMGEGSQKIVREYGMRSIKSDLLPEWAKLLPLPMGMHAADQIVTVSPGYAQELETEQFGDGLVRFIQSGKKLKGILNGIDTSIWNPASDLHIEQQYSVSSMHLKTENKDHLFKHFHLPTNSKIPLLFFISRLDPQKGVELLIRCLDEIRNDDFQAIILGTGNQLLENALLDLMNSYPSKIHVVLQFNPALAHQLYAAGDILLMPSKYEPCGLSQMIAMHYGCVPVAHAVGGLKDSIISEPEAKRTGYLFHEFTVDAFTAALREAIADFNHPEKWRAIQARGMRQDFSWNHSAKEYAQVYSDLLRKDEQS